MPPAKLVALLKPKRRWAQFSLTTVFVVVTVLCVSLAFAVNRAHRRWEAVVAIEKSGGWVSYDYQRDDSGAYLPNAKPPGPGWLRRMLGDNFLAKPVGVQLFADSKSGMKPEEFTDVQASMIGVLTELRWLVLKDTAITDESLTYFAGLSRLKSLDLEHTVVTDAGVAKLKGVLPTCTIYHSSGCARPGRREE